MSLFCENCLAKVDDGDGLCGRCDGKSKGKSFFEFSPDKQREVLKQFKSDKACVVKGTLITSIPALLAAALYVFVFKVFSINIEALIIFFIVGLLVDSKICHKKVLELEKQEEWSKAHGYMKGGASFLAVGLVATLIWVLCNAAQLLKLMGLY